MSKPAETDPHLRRDALHSLIVAALAVLLSAGLVYLVYLRRVLRIARRSSASVEAPGTLLVFGKRLVDGEPDADYRRRLQRAHALAGARPVQALVLLGGGPPGATEAEVGLAQLRRLGLPEGLPVQLEDRSRDTLQNLRNARALLGADHGGPLLLVSNRYHLARCAQLAGQLGLDYQLCAAEPGFRLREQGVARLLVEAGYLCWIDLGTGWARLIGHRRMLARVT
jgi:uncharacterized SAM-binding protein YcdF (DUF218 family)